MDMANRRIRLKGVRRDLIQTIRLGHALAEAGVPLAVRPTELAAYRWLDNFFPGLDWRVSRFARSFENVAVNHREPLTTVGGISQPLIFPHGIADRCEDKWTKRDRTIVFVGSMTDERRMTLARLAASFGDDFRPIATNAGRVWPSKAWDDEYYTVLGRTRLAACPSGDFIWTYRFFEAALSGAIPVVEADCPHYEGFHYYRMSDDPKSMQWRQDWADHNLARSRAALTVPHKVLFRAVYGP